MSKSVGRKTGIAMAMVAAMGTTGCKHLEGVGDRLGLPSPPRVEDRTDLARWSVQLDSVAASLRRYDLTAAASPSTALQIKASSGLDDHTVPTENYPLYLEGYVRARKDQVDGLCGLFFNDLQGLSSTSRWGRDQVNILAEFTSLMMGLTGAASRQLAILSGAQVLFNDSYDAASAALLISADPYRVHRAVRAEQRKFESEHAGGITTFRRAEEVVRGYAEPCTLMGVQRLISEALDAQYQGAAEGSARLALRVSSLVATLNDVPVTDAAPLAADDLNENALAAMFWLLTLDPADDKEREAALASLPAPVKARLQALTAVDNASRRTVIAGQLEQIVSLSPPVGRNARELQASYRTTETVRIAAETSAKANADVLNAANNAVAIARTAAASADAAATRAADAAETRTTTEPTGDTGSTPPTQEAPSGETPPPQGSAGPPGT